MTLEHVRGFIDLLHILLHCSLLHVSLPIGHTNWKSFFFFNRVFFQAACDVPAPEEKFNVDEYSDMVTLSKPVIYISIEEIINTHSVRPSSWAHLCTSDILFFVINKCSQHLPPSMILSCGYLSHFLYVFLGLFNIYMFACYKTLLWNRSLLLWYFGLFSKKKKRQKVL